MPGAPALRSCSKPRRAFREKNVLFGVPGTSRVLKSVYFSLFAAKVIRFKASYALKRQQKKSDYSYSLDCS